ncbi:MAG: SWF/SNF helicase family protein, partial [Promicromonosporaceae bacterium]|nr:SWF/SNF helicase family protein [Promicromonosporaceae bacterium]
FFSSPAALRESIINRLITLRSSHNNDGDLRLDAQDSPHAIETLALERLLTLADRALTQPSAKYDALVDYLQNLKVGGSSSVRAVVFAERVATLNWLAEKLPKDLKLPKGAVAVLHGGLSDQEQLAIIDDFKLESSPIRILITGDVASEGVNLHLQCHNLIHYDIPWSLIRIEQRNGRIDRYGQQNRPQIATLLLDPQSTRRFRGDIRVLTKLVEREHHAHEALGDASSLMGKHDIGREEDEILKVLRGAARFDDVVKEVADVKDSPGLDGLFARLVAESAATQNSAPQEREKITLPEKNFDNGAGLYPSPLEFLSDALAEVYPTPGSSAPSGVSWKVAAQHGIASLEPPRDLRQRLLTLPQTYLRDRQVTSQLRLATTIHQGQKALSDARSGGSTSTWPEASYLTPLHPVIEWATDRALATLGRNQVFAVRGEVPETTVLVAANLYNARSQVVATSYVTVAFPNPQNPEFSLPEAHPSSAVAVAALGLLNANRDDLRDTQLLDPLIPNAVRAATALVDAQIGEIKQVSETRVAAWQTRAQHWAVEASAEMSGRIGGARPALAHRSEDVAAATQLAQLMLPTRTLVRPLLVVVPTDLEIEE